MYNKITNPLTNRKVNINSKLGKKIISNYIKLSFGGASLFDKVDKRATAPLPPIDPCLNMKEVTDKFLESFKGADKLDYNKLSQLTGNDRRAWAMCPNEPDGHCFYWTLARYFINYNLFSEYLDLGPGRFDTQTKIETTAYNLRKAVMEKAIQVHEQKIKIADQQISKASETLILTKPGTTERKEAEKQLKIRQENLERSRMLSPEINDDYNNMRIGLRKARLGRGCGSNGYATDVDVNAAAKLFNICICVWDPIYSYWTVSIPEYLEKITDYNLAVDCNHVLFCINTNGNHFDSLVPISHIKEPILDEVVDEESRPERFSSSELAEMLEVSRMDARQMIDQGIM